MKRRGRKRNLLARLYIWVTQRLYNELAWAYDLVAWTVSLGRWDRWRRMALDYVPGQPVLEVGFGTGDLLMEMAGRGWQVVGIDLSPAMHRVTAVKMRHRRLWARRVRGRVQTLPFPDGYFATIISTFPAGFIADPATLREFSRVLRPPANGSPAGRLIVVGTWVEIDHPMLRLFSGLLAGISVNRYMAHFRRVCDAVGLEVTVISQVDPPVQVPVIIAEKRA